MARKEWLADELACRRCGQIVEAPEMDRMLWCERCRLRARHRATQYGVWAGAALAVVLAVYIWLVIQPSNLVIGGWIATVVAAFWLGSKVAREVSFGLIRARAEPIEPAGPPSSEP